MILKVQLLQFNNHQLHKYKINHWLELEVNHATAQPIVKLKIKITLNSSNKDYWEKMLQMENKVLKDKKDYKVYKEIKVQEEKMELNLPMNILNQSQNK